MKRPLRRGDLFFHFGHTINKIDSTLLIALLKGLSRDMCVYIIYIYI